MRDVEWLAIVTIGMAGLSCYSPQIPRCLRCEADDSCPQGQTCKRGYCEAPSMSCSPVNDGAPADLTSDVTTSDSDGEWDGAAARPDGAGDARPEAGSSPPSCPIYQYWNAVQLTCVPAHDLNGDGRADLLAVNGTDMQALISDGRSFGEEKWLDGAFYGVAGRAFAADVTDSGFASGVAL